jgi:hypothetical protein
MSNLDELFCRLIRSNRRIIIPDIGAFITNSHDENTVFSPLLKHNDGFLEEELQKEGVADSAVFLRELAENIISVIERGQHYYIFGLGYFLKDGSIRFVFEETEKDVAGEQEDVAGEHSGDAWFSKNKGNKSKLWIIAGLICLCIIVFMLLLFLIFKIYSSRDRSEMFTFQVEKPADRFVIVDKSDTCGGINDLQSFPKAKNYHVVAACFEEKDNAEKFVFQCRKNGYDQAEILFLTSVFYPVSIGAFPSQDEALICKQEYESRFGGYSIILISK